VVCRADIRRGLDFAALKRGDYRSACLALRAEWSFWRRTAPLYRFGRTELLPIRKGARDLSQYVGKYVAKHAAQRLPCDRRVRLVSCSRRARVATTRFSWAYGYAACCRRGIPFLLAELNRLGAISNSDEPSVVSVYGLRWRYRFRESIAMLGSGDGRPPIFFLPELSREFSRCLS
jgi:hypothetical protein